MIDKYSELRTLEKRLAAVETWKSEEAGKIAAKLDDRAIARRWKAIRALSDEATELAVKSGLVTDEEVEAATEA